MTLGWLPTAGLVVGPHAVPPCSAHENGTVAFEAGSLRGFDGGASGGEPRPPSRRFPLLERPCQNAALSEIEKPGSYGHEIESESVRNLGIRAQRWSHHELQEATDRRIHNARL